MTPQQSFMRSVWIKALASPTPLEFDVKSPSKVHTLRFTLYNAVRSVKAKPQSDPELYRAVCECSISCPKDRPTVLIIGKALQTELMSMIAEQLDVKPEAAGQDEIAESLKRLQAGLGIPTDEPTDADGNPAPRHTKYYDR